MIKFGEWLYAFDFTILWYFIRMFINDQEQHHLPHFHVIYGEYSGTFTLDGAISGNIPKKQQKLIVAWVTIHQEELEALWISV